MNKLKILFLTALLFSFPGGQTAITAQTTNDILVSVGGKTLRSADIRTMIEFYEFVFKANFSGAEQRDFTENSVREFKADPKGSRAALDQITAALPKLRAASAEIQQKFRAEFLAEFLPEARKNTDANSRLLLAIYESANGPGDDSAMTDNTVDESDASNNDAQVSPVGNISALAGKWAWGRSGSSTYSTGGAYQGSNGSRFTYQFYANGSVQFTGIMNVMTGGCNMQIFRTANGKASLNGQTLTINWSPASFSRDDSCSPSKNYKKTLPAEIETFQVRFRTDSGQKQLCLIGKDETCYSPAE